MGTTIKPGQVYRTITAKDGRPVTLRTPRWEDLDDFLALINGLLIRDILTRYHERLPQEDGKAGFGIATAT